MHWPGEEIGLKDGKTRIRTRGGRCVTPSDVSGENVLLETCTERETDLTRSKSMDEPIRGLREAQRQVYRE